MAQGLRGQMAHVRRLWIHPSWRRAKPGATAGAATHFVFTINTATTCTASVFTVTAYDSSNNIATGYTGTVTFTGGGPGATLPANATLTNGIGIFSTTLTYAGNTVLTAVDVVTSSITGATASINVSAKLTGTLLAVGNRTGPGGISLLLSNGNGTFQANAQFNSGDASPAEIAVGDFTGNGLADMASANWSATANSGAGVRIMLGNCNATFQLGTTYTAGQQPYSIKTADLNGDGKMDLVVSNYTVFGTTTPSRVGVYLGNGNGTFQAPQTYGVGARPKGLALADLNGDGILDIVCVNYNSSTVSVLLNNGDATFQAQKTFTTGSGPWNAWVIDVDGDGNLDLITSDAGTNKVSVLLGNNNGTFKAKTDFTTAANPYGLVVADLNGDGKWDIAVTPQGAVSVSVLLGNGNGTFGAKTDFVAGTSCKEITAVDLNGDGKLDLLASAFGDNKVAVLLGNGNGTFQISTEFGTGTNPVGLALIPYPWTGVMKFTITAPTNVTFGVGFVYTVTAATVAGPTQTAYQGTIHLASTDTAATLAANPTLTSGVGTFTATLNTAGSQKLLAVDILNTSLTGVSPSITVLRNLDILVNNRTDNTVGVLLGNGNGTFGAMVTYAQPATTINAFAAADLNGDGHLDLVTGCTGGVGSRNVASLLGNGNGTFQANTAFAQGNAINWMAAGALHGGTTQDVAYCFSGNTAVLLGNGNGTFGAATAFASQTTRIVIADVNADGIQDLITTGNTSIGCLLGNGNGTFQAQVNTSGLANGVFTVVADVNNDGKQDLITSSSNAAKVVCVNLGNGNGTFQAFSTFGVGSSPKGLVCTDLNGDGVNDLAVCNYTDSTVSVLLGNNNGTFQAQTAFTTAGAAYGIAAADINGDGKVDLVVTDQSTNQVSILLGNGNGTFQAKTDLTVGTSPRQIALARTTQ